MEQVTYPNGVVLEWDDTLMVGELVITYEKGYHILTGFQFRDNQTPLASYVRVLSESGKKMKSKATRTCDASFVLRVTRDDINRQCQEEMNALIQKRLNLLEYATR